MEYITLCLDSTNEVEQWYVRHNYLFVRVLAWKWTVWIWQFRWQW